MKTFKFESIFPSGIAVLYFAISFYLFEKFGTWNSVEGLLAAVYSNALYPISWDYSLMDSTLFFPPLLYPIYSKYFFETQIHSYITFGVAFFLIVKIFLQSRTLLTNSFYSKFNKEVLSIFILVLLLPNLLCLSTSSNAILVFLVFTIKYFKDTEDFYKKAFLFLFAVILRLDIVVLLSYFLSVILIIMNWKIKLKYLYPFIAALIIYFIFNIYLKLFASESYQSFYFFELEIMDKKNFSLEKIAKTDALQLYYFVTAGIINDQVFTLDFYKRILEVNQNNLINSFLNLQLFFNTFTASIPEILLTKSIIVFSFFLKLNILIKRSACKVKIVSILMFLFPFSLCFFVILPNRFLSPYYSIISILYLFYIVRNYRPTAISLALLLGIAVICTYMNINSSYILAKSNHDIYEKTIVKVQLINQKYPKKQLFTGDLASNNYLFFPYKATAKTPITNVHYINYLYFSTFDSFKDEWKEICHCNPYSFKEKLEYIASTNSLIMLDKKMTVTYSEYYKKLYNQELIFNEVDSEIEELYTIHFNIKELKKQ